MSCFNNCYLPQPPRAWSRVQNQCTYIITDSSYNSSYMPLTNQNLSLSQENYENKLNENRSTNKKFHRKPC